MHLKRSIFLALSVVFSSECNATYEIPPAPFVENSSSQLEKGGDAILSQLVMVMKANQGIRIELVGFAGRHETPRGALIRDRAQFVYHYLLDHGIAASQIVETRPSTLREENVYCDPNRIPDCDMNLRMVLWNVRP